MMNSSADRSICIFHRAIRLGFFIACYLGMAAYLTSPLLAQSSTAGSTEEDVFASPDITFDRHGTIVDDDQVVNSRIPVLFNDLGPLAKHVAVVAVDKFRGEQFFVLDQATELPGPLFVEPRDVVLKVGSSYFSLFRGSDHGVPRGARIDALLLQGIAIYMSFDITVEIDDLTIDDEDLVFFNQVSSEWTFVFDASERGIAPGLDLDALGVTSSFSAALSFDGSGIAEGIPFDDEDVLEISLSDSSDWQVIFDGSAVSSGWQPADLDALFIEPPPRGPLFADGFELGNASAWSNVQP